MSGAVSASTLAYAAIAAAAVSAYGTYQQGQNQEKLADYNAKVAENNAKTNEMAAEDALRRGGVAEDAQRAKTRQILGTQRAAFAANGGDLTDQSTVNVMSDAARYGEMDALTVRNNAAREAWGFTNAASDSRNQSQALTLQGNMASQAGNIGAAGSMLQGFVQAGKISKMK